MTVTKANNYMTVSSIQITAVACVSLSLFLSPDIFPVTLTILCLYLPHRISCTEVSITHTGL